MTVDVPSISGKIVGSSDSLNLSFWLSSGSSYNARTNNLGLQNITVDFADIEIKEVLPGYGDQFPGFERLARDTDLVRCQRYFELAYFSLVFSPPAASYYFHTRVYFKSAKRVVPSCSLSLGSQTNNASGYPQVDTGQIVTGDSAAVTAVSAGGGTLLANGWLIANAEF